MSSSTVSVSGLPPNTAPSYFAKVLGSPLTSSIEDIVGLGTSLHVKFNSPENAAAFVRDYDSRRLDFGIHGQARIIFAKIIPDHEFPQHYEPDRCLSAFLKVSKEEEKLQSSTVSIRNLPDSHVIRNVYQMFDEQMEGLNMSMCDDKDWIYASIEYIEVIGYGETLVRFSSVDMAGEAVYEWNGNYWKWDTVYLKCVPDEELDDYIKAAKENRAKGKQVMLFVAGVGLGADRAFIEDVFHGYQLCDVKLMPEKNFAFAFLTKQEAGIFFTRYPGGKRGRVGGRYYKVYLDKKSKVSEKALVDEAAAKGVKSDSADNPVNGSTTLLTVSLQQPAQATPAPKLGAVSLPFRQGPPDSRFTNDVRVSNLHYNATKQDIRNAFQAFKITKVVIKQGFAWIGLTTKDEAKRAVATLSGKRVRGRPITISLAQPLEMPT